MAWVFPKSLVRTGTVLDWLEFDELVQIYTSEVNGNLSAHNFDVDTGDDLLSAGKVEENVAVRVFNESVAEDAFTLGDLFQIPHSEQWTPITVCETEPRGPGGKLFVTFSFQVVYDDTTVVDQTPGLQFEIEIDDNPQSSTHLGSADMGNDRYHSSTTVSAQLPVVAGGSVRGRFTPHCVEGVFVIDAGKHLVRLVARNPYTVNGTTRPKQYIGSIECIAMHLRA